MDGSCCRHGRVVLCARASTVKTECSWDTQYECEMRFRMCRCSMHVNVEGESPPSLFCIYHPFYGLFCGRWSVIIKSSLAPFNCTLSNGVWIMVAAPNIVCNVPGGAHLRMKAVGSVMMAVFVVGVPVVFAAILYFHRDEIVKDQTMRQNGEGDTFLTNPNIHVRYRYRKLYEDYKPKYAYWKLVLLGRKLAFAMVVVLLTQHVETQVCRCCCLPSLPQYRCHSSVPLLSRGSGVVTCLCCDATTVVDADVAHPCSPLHLPPCVSGEPVRDGAVHVVHPATKAVAVRAHPRHLHRPGHHFRQPVQTAVVAVRHRRQTGGRWRTRRACRCSVR